MHIAGLVSPRVRWLRLARRISSREGLGLDLVDDVQPAAELGRNKL